MTTVDSVKHVAPPPGATVLQAQGVTMRFGGLTAVNNVDLTVREGEIVGHRLRVIEADAGSRRGAHRDRDDRPLAGELRIARRGAHLAEVQVQVVATRDKIALRTRVQDRPRVIEEREVPAEANDRQ